MEDGASGMYRVDPSLDARSPRQVTHLPPAWDILLPLAESSDRRDQRLIGCQPKDTGKVVVSEIAQAPKLGVPVSK